MDKKSFIGLVLIGAILIGWSFFMSPSKQETARIQRYNDSISLEERKAEAASKAQMRQKAMAAGTAEMKIDTSHGANDSLRTSMRLKQYGPFTESAGKKETYVFIENEHYKVKLSTRGGRPVSVELKKFKAKTSDGPAVVLFTEDSSTFALQLFDNNNRAYSTDSLYFAPTAEGFSVKGEESKTISMRLSAGTGKYIEYVYTLKGNDYMMGCHINMIGMQDVIASNMQDLDLKWTMKAPSLEKDLKNQRIKSTVYYKLQDEDVDYLSESKDENKTLAGTNVKWIAFKQQFFTSVLITDNNCGRTKPTVETHTDKEDTLHVKNYSARLSIPFTHKASETFAMRFYFGPNQYYTLKSYGLDLERQIPLGWSLFRYVNKWLVIPIFNFLDSFNISYGIIILILTLIIKLLIFPIAYKTYLSSAKMRVVKPEVDEINAKFKDGDPLKKQQATMALYKKAGINPMAGCIPVLLQMPILIALVSFFPSAIELRQKGFLWAHDLSTYDSILQLPFNIPFYGDHVSLFALLMTGSTILYTYTNSQLMGSTDQMPGMKWMMYLMPVMFLGFMNSYSSGLSYYYFLANMITFGQTWLMRKFVDEAAIHRKIQENKLKPVKTSSWQQRLEKAARDRQAALQQAPKKKK
ncbi:MAG TPA: membrane protein insertase YidC [Bacteroidia bacterium]|jgi:YidC/Oxa1 family membrane protein insertase|nr:membrane protein insertase YidC [Bacteroidia bacterium]